MVMLVTEKRTIALLLSQLEKDDATTAAIKSYFLSYCDHDVVAWIKDQITGNNTQVISKIQELIAAPQSTIVEYTKNKRPAGYLLRSWYAGSNLACQYVGSDGVTVETVLRAGTATKPISVDLCGDSVMRGVLVVLSPIDYIKQNRTAWTVTDHAAGGLTTRDLLGGYAIPDAGLPTEYWPNGPQPAFELITRAHKVVVLQTGFNDAFRNVPNFDTNMRKLVDIVLREDRIPVLTGVFNINNAVAGRAANNAATLQIAADYGLQHAGWNEDFFSTDVGTDAIHMTQAASNRHAVALIAAIERAIA